MHLTVEIEPARRVISDSVMHRFDNRVRCMTLQLAYTPYETTKLYKALERNVRNEALSKIHLPIFPLVLARVGWTDAGNPTRIELKYWSSPAHSNLHGLNSLIYNNNKL